MYWADCMSNINLYLLTKRCVIMTSYHMHAKLSPSLPEELDDLLCYQAKEAQAYHISQQTKIRQWVKHLSCFGRIPVIYRVRKTQINLYVSIILDWFPMIIQRQTTGILQKCGSLIGWKKSNPSDNMHIN